MLLLIHCCLLLQGMHLFDTCFAISSLYSFRSGNSLAERRTSCLTMVVFMLSCGCLVLHNSYLWFLRLVCDFGVSGWLFDRHGIPRWGRMQLSGFRPVVCHTTDKLFCAYHLRSCHSLVFEKTCCQRPCWNTRLIQANTTQQNRLHVHWTHMHPSPSKTTPKTSKGDHISIRHGEHTHAIEEESNVANSDWVAHQACILLQYINFNLCIMGNYFDKLRWKIIRANNLLQFIHHKIQIPKSLAQERFKSNFEFRYQIIVSSIKFRKGFVKFMIPIALFK